MSYCVESIERAQENDHGNGSQMVDVLFTKANHCFTFLHHQKDLFLDVDRARIMNNRFECLGQGVCSGHVLDMLAVGVDGPQHLTELNPYATNVVEKFFQKT